MSEIATLLQLIDAPLQAGILICLWRLDRRLLSMEIQREKGYL